MINLIRRMYARILFWKWDHDFHAAVKRMRGCAHTRTMFVDVGTVTEKCCDCWAIRVPKLGRTSNELPDEGEMEWTPNSANPRRSRQVAPPTGAKTMKPEMTRYHFRFRPLAGPLQVRTMEAGPFTYNEAARFGRKEIERRVLRTGVVWVVDYAPIEDKPTTPWALAAIFLILVLVSALGYLIDTEVIR